ncbi:MAG: alanine racemase [Gemmatimonadales bacterium]|nr:MAG: alanine racemase [Gemmatimonadales bacterium]
MKLDDIPTPALLLDLDRAERNIAAMAERGRRLGVGLRPHIKTHKCLELAELQRAAGASGITVSTLYEAAVFARHGFRDITWAFPVIPGRLEEARALCEEIGPELELGLVVDHEESLAAVERAGVPFKVWLKVDCGYHRAGVDPAKRASLELAARIASSPVVRFAGILSHSGQAYSARRPPELARIAERERRIMVEFAARLEEAGVKVPAVSVGSTPAMSRVRRLDGVTEARPGNYVFYDYTQRVLGACSLGACALTVLATVVSSQPGNRHCVVDAGALALSKDPGPERARPRAMGRIFADYQSNRLDPSRYLVSLSQEHGIVRGRFPVGTRVRILPNHACLAAACFDQYYVVRGDRVVDRWKIWRGR